MKMTDIRYRRDLWKLFVKKEPEMFKVRPKGLGASAEIGVAEGNFSEDMLNWPVIFPKHYMVDRWKCTPTQAGDASMDQTWHDKNFNSVKKRTAQFGSRAVILRGNSVEMADEVPDLSLSLLYIDGDHSYEGCFADLRAWTPKVKLRGYVALHDFLNEAYGVRRAVEDFCRGAGFKIHIIREDKPEDAGALFQLC